uniref:Uncharacterized protein n=1 Tax=Physcomitrium patens TaxID=3218 RepID=A0A2K1J7Y4_PHYPA|nr:hypothetical protein PHYPA_020738 [Physcomitrium patens]
MFLNYLCTGGRLRINRENSKGGSVQTWQGSQTGRKEGVAPTLPFKPAAIVANRTEFQDQPRCKEMSNSQSPVE